MIYIYIYIYIYNTDQRKSVKRDESYLLTIPNLNHEF